MRPCNPSKPFSRIALQELGHTLCRRPVASEKDLEDYERFAVEEEVKGVMKQLITVAAAQPLLNNYHEIEFETHLNTLSDNTEEVLERQKTSRSGSSVCLLEHRRSSQSSMCPRVQSSAY